MEVRRRAPDPRLRGVVRGYSARTGDLAATVKRIPLPARPDVLLEFYFATPHLVELQGAGTRERAPWTVAVGPQSFRRVDLLLCGRLDVFTASLEATGLHALFGVPMTELADTAVDAAHLFGAAAARELADRLAAASGLEARAAITDAALLSRLALRPAVGGDPLEAAVSRLRLTHGAQPVARLAREVGLSPRHFARLFAARVGMAPKAYARVLRLDAALAARAADPGASWTELAHRYGWYDQAHMDKDFRRLAGDTPTGFAAALAQPPVIRAAAAV